MIYLYLIISVLLGSFLVFFIKPSNFFIKLLLAFSGAYLLSVTILHLLPEVYTLEHEHHSVKHQFSNTKLVGILILTGILLQSILESFSKGLEHGHIHVHKNKKTNIPWTLLIGLCIHAFMEGLPIHNSNHSILWGIVVHKIPIAIVLTSFLMYSKLSKVNICLIVLFFSLMSPLGYFIGNKIHFFTNFNHEITALIIGVFLHISTVILFESSDDHSFNFKKFISILSAILLAILTM